MNDHCPLVLASSTAAASKIASSSIFSENII
jgi:hypothetical protein